MNTIGKILVILNFLFAVIVGIVMVVVTSMRTPWKESYVELEKQAHILKAQREAYQKVAIGLENDKRKVKEDKDAIAQSLKDKETELDTQKSLADIKIKQYEMQANNAQAALAQAVNTTKVQANEIAVLNKTIDSREAIIVKLEADSKVVRVQAQNFEALARARQIQNENLLEDIRGYTRKIAQMESGVNPDIVAVRDPNSPNPPAVVVNGRVERVDDKDRTLIQITLGTDHGVNKNHTLDVYRTKPEPKYLGMVRILEAYHQKSVAQLVTTGNAAYRPQLRPDDLVTSKLTR